MFTCRKIMRRFIKLALSAFVFSCIGTAQAAVTCGTQKANAISPSTINLTAGGSLAVTFSVTPISSPAPGGYLFRVKKNPKAAIVTFTQTGTTGAFNFTGVGAGTTKMDIEVEALDTGGTASGCKNVFKGIPITVTTGTASACNPPTLSPFATYTTNMNTPLSETAANIASHISGGTGPFLFSYVVTTSSTSAGSLTGNSSDGSFTYTPLLNWTGTYTFDLEVAPTCDPTKKVTQPITISVVDPGATPPATCQPPTLAPLGTISLGAGQSYTGTPSASGGTPPYVYSIATTTPATPAHGTIVLNNTVTGSFTYTAATGFSGTDSFTLLVASSCDPTLKNASTASVNITNNATGTYSSVPGSGNLATNGAIIVDNTPNPGTPGVVTNMTTNLGGKQFGVANAFNINGIQVMQRDNKTSPHQLVDEAGYNNANSTSYANYGTSKQTNYFANGQHLFDLDRLRAAADWLSANIAPVYNPAACTLVNPTFTPAPMSPPYDETGPTVPMPTTRGQCHPAGTYGTISWHQFLDNIANNRTMWGIVRVLVPLQLGTAKSTNNALNQTVGAGQIYGFCATTTGLCADAPTGSTDIKPGAAVAGNNSVPVTIPTNGQIRMRGVLMLDFVNGYGDAVYPIAGTPISLDHLPYQPRDIYFKVSVPINVNAAHDRDGDGAMDNMDYINSLTSGITCTTLPCSTTIPNTTTINSNKVPIDAVAAYNYQFNTQYTGPTDPGFVTMFNAADKATQYHLLMPSGYAQGFADAFTELGITAQQWQNLGFSVPPGVDMTKPLTVHDIRNNAFEDLPVYLYTGGLVDMHHHLNVSGLLYVPQALEQEAKQATTRQFIFGGVVVRDGFYIEARAGSVTVTSSDPASFASIKINPNAVSGAMLSTASSTMHSAAASSSPIGVGLGGGSSASSSSQVLGSAGSAVSVGKVRWIEIHPR